MRWQWEPQPQAGEFLRKHVVAISGEVPFARHLYTRLRDEAGTRLEDMLDILLLPDADVREAELCGWSSTGQMEDGYAIYENPRGQFPRIGLAEQTCFYMKVENVQTFLDAHDLVAEITGEQHSGRRRAVVDRTRSAAFGVM